MWNESRLLEFWAFIAERHEVFRRRIILKQPPPWTKDPVLATVAFTNIYRELDRTTRLLMRTIPNKHPNLATDEDVLFNVIKFRFFTWPWTYYALGGFQPAAWWNGARAARMLVSRQKAGHQIFTGAFMVTSLGAKPGVGGKARLVVNRITWVKKNLGQLTKAVFGAVTMDEAHRTLTEVPGFGGFMAYEVLIDLTYTGRVSYGTDSWVYVGPGAVKGLRELITVPVVRRMHERSLAMQELVALLRDRQEDGFRDAGVVLNGPRLTLENIEQALCEYQKYRRAKERGRAKRKFHWIAASCDYTPWDDIPGSFR